MRIEGQKTENTVPRQGNWKNRLNQGLSSTKSTSVTERKYKNWRQERIIPHCIQHHLIFLGTKIGLLIIPILIKVGYSAVSKARYDHYNHQFPRSKMAVGYF